MFRNWIWKRKTRLQNLLRFSRSSEESRASCRMIERWICIDDRGSCLSCAIRCASWAVKYRTIHRSIFRIHHLLWISTNCLMSGSNLPHLILSKSKTTVARRERKFAQSDWKNVPPEKYHCSLTKKLRPILDRFSVLLVPRKYHGFLRSRRSSHRI